jgi:hypothetical protein
MKTSLLLWAIPLVAAAQPPPLPPDMLLKETIRQEKPYVILETEQGMVDVVERMAARCTQDRTSQSEPWGGWFRAGELDKLAKARWCSPGNPAQVTRVWPTASGRTYVMHMRLRTYFRPGPRDPRFAGQKWRVHGNEANIQLERGPDGKEVWFIDWADDRTLYQLWMDKPSNDRDADIKWLLEIADSI